MFEKLTSRLPLDWGAYKARCDEPDVWTRWMLEQSLELIADPAAAGAVRAALAGKPLEKPPDHKGDAVTDVLLLVLTREQAVGVVTDVEAAVAGGARTSATGARGLGGFAQAWREYLCYLEGLDDE